MTASIKDRLAGLGTYDWQQIETAATADLSSESVFWPPLRQAIAKALGRPLAPWENSAWVKGYCQALLLVRPVTQVAFVEAPPAVTFLSATSGFWTSDVRQARPVAAVKIDDIEYLPLPSELTYENGAKYLLVGEFSESIELTDEDGDTYQQPVPVRWSTIKRIYREAAKWFLDNPYRASPRGVKPFVRGVDWDIFDTGGGRMQVQADDEAGTLSDEQAVIEARKAGITADDEGFILESDD